MRKVFVSAAIFFLVLSAASSGLGRCGDDMPAASQQKIVGYLEKGTIIIRIFEGSADNLTPPAKTVASSSLQYDLSATVSSDEDPEAQSRRIRNAFNLKSVTVLNSAIVSWERGITPPIRRTLRIEDKLNLRLEISPTDISEQKFKIDVFEQNDGAQINLLSTEAGLPKNISTVFGFKDVQGKPYFVSLQIGEWSVVAGKTTVQTLATPPVSAEGPVRATGEIQPPELVKMVEPIYPDSAFKAGVEGVVILEAATDEYGRVHSTKILRSIPLLDQAAEDAVKQWVYEPMIIQGKPRGIIFTVTVRFDLNGKTTRVSGGPEPAIAQAPPIPAEGPVRAVGGKIEPPQIVKRVDPVYPDIARKARIEGIVILEATTDIYGAVKNTKILRSIPILDQAATDAVKQWVYEPMVIDGRPREVTFTVTVRFTLTDGGGPLSSMLLISADGPGTVQIKQSVEPVYPKEALKAKAEGTVILEAYINPNGGVEDVRVIRPVHPALDKAAEDALKEWKFESTPLPIVGGKFDRRSVVLSALFSLEGRPKVYYGGVMGGVIGGVEGGVEGGVVGGVEGGVEGGVIKADLSDKAFREGAALPPVRAEDNIQPPGLVKRVEPLYPAEAREARVEGIVILEATTDVYGRVAAINVLRSIPLLDQAAKDAVRQWVYKPLLIDGKPRGCVFTVTVRFTLK